jgi:hypothetical protein
MACVRALTAETFVSSAPGRAGQAGKPWSAVPMHWALASLRDSALLQTLLAAVLVLVLGALAIVSISGAESTQSSAETAGSSPTPSKAARGARPGM